MTDEFKADERPAAIFSDDGLQVRISIDIDRKLYDFAAELAQKNDEWPNSAEQEIEMMVGHELIERIVFDWCLPPDIKKHYIERRIAEGKPVSQEVAEGYKATQNAPDEEAEVKKRKNQRAGTAPCDNRFLMRVVLHIDRDMYECAADRADELTDDPRTCAEEQLELLLEECFPLHRKNEALH